MKTFAQFMEDALYGPQGYYSSGRARSGKTGDYFTAPDVSPIFGRLLAVHFKRWASALALDTTLIELGSGTGELAHSVMSTLPEFSYTLIERSEARLNALRQKKWPSRHSAIIDTDVRNLASKEGIIFANELLDAFPVHKIRKINDRLEEGFVSDQTPLAWHWTSPSTPELAHYLDANKIDLTNGQEGEISLELFSWAKSLSDFLTKGIGIFIDYGRPGHEHWDPARTRGTLRGFRTHALSDVFENPGLTDLTADVDFSATARALQDVGFEPIAFYEMGSFLRVALENLEEKELQDLPRPALKYLLHPDGLGSAFHILIVAKGIDAPSFQKVLPYNRLKRLRLTRDVVSEMAS